MSIITQGNLIISERTKGIVGQYFDDKEQIRVAISTMTAGIPEGVKPFLYASTAISTGKRLLDAMHKHGYKSKEEFMKKDIESYRREVLIPNIEDGNEFAADCEKFALEKTQNKYIFAPSKFAGGMRWKDIQYMVFYRPIVEKYCWGMIFNKRSGFTASTGCLEEFSMGLEHGKELYVWEGPGKIVLADPQAIISEAFEFLAQICEVTGEVPTRFAEYWLDSAVRVGSKQDQTDIKKLAEFKKG